MNMDKAIEIQSHLLKTSSREKSPDPWDVLKLSLEAMKAIRDIRQKHLTYTIDLLPGETED